MRMHMKACPARTSKHDFPLKNGFITMVLAMS